MGIVTKSKDIPVNVFYVITVGSPPVLRTQTRPPTVSIPEETRSQHAQNVYTPTPEEHHISGGTGEGKLGLVDVGMFKKPTQQLFLVSYSHVVILCCMQLLSILYNNYFRCC